MGEVGNLLSVIISKSHALKTIRIIKIKYRNFFFNNIYKLYKILYKNIIIMNYKH